MLAKQLWSGHSTPLCLNWICLFWHPLHVKWFSVLVSGRLRVSLRVTLMINLGERWRDGAPRGQRSVCELHQMLEWMKGSRDQCWQSKADHRWLVMVEIEGSCFGLTLWVTTIITFLNWDVIFALKCVLHLQSLFFKTVNPFVQMMWKFLMSTAVVQCHRNSY